MTRSIVSLFALLAACGPHQGDAAASPSRTTDAGGTGDGSTSPPTDDAEASPADAGAPARDGACTPCGACPELLSVGTATHVAGGVDYTDVPPVGGPHDPCWKAFGAYTSEVPDERWVHNLEHGGVVFLHHCDDCADDVAALDAFANGHAMALSTPYAALPARFAVVAWGVRLVSDCYDPDAFAAFYAAHVDHGPESVSGPPPASVCSP